MSYKASATDSLPTSRSHATDPGVVSHRQMMLSPRNTVMADARVDLMRDVLLALVRRDGRDLTARQLSAFLIVYTSDHVQTVSSLAELMNISRPGVTRVMDRLVRFDLMAREEDADDRRRVLARRTARGLAFQQDLAALARDAAEGRVDSLPPTAFMAVSGRA